MMMTHKKNIVIIAISIVIIIIIATFSYFFFNKTDDKNIVYGDYTIYKTTQGKIEDYDKTNNVEGYLGGEKAYYISGEISAKKNKKFTIIIYDLYDKQNNKLGVAKAGLKEVKKDKKYKYKALSLINKNKLDEIDHYKLKLVKES